MTSKRGLFIKGTGKTPEIDFLPGKLKISGRSIPEDSIAFYQPILSWIEDYLKNPEQSTKVILRIEYINSGSNRFIYQMLKLLDESFLKGNVVSVSWLYEDDDDTIKGLGQDFMSLLQVPFKLVEI